MTSDYWVYAQRKDGKYPEHTSRGGKWLIFVGGHNLSRIWRRIIIATEEGKLGGLAKASKHSSCAQSSNNGVICVYTYDWKDIQDVERIRVGLRKIGIIRKISYKTDEDTERRVYRANSSEKISKYYE